MGDFVAYPSMPRFALMLACSLAFVAIGLWEAGEIGSAPAFARYPDWFTSAVGWICVLFFGLCGAVAFRKLFQTGEQLRIGPSGIRWAPWRRVIPWAEITDVTIYSRNRQSSIVLHLRDPSICPRSWRFAMFGTRYMSGGDLAFPMIATDRSLQEAMAAIARFRPPAKLDS